MIDSKIEKVEDLRDPIITLAERISNREKSIYVVTQDLLLQDELDEIINNEQFIFSTIYETDNLTKSFSEYNPPSVIIIDYDTIKNLSGVIYKIKELAPISPIILLSRKTIGIDNIIFESILFYGMINEIYKNKEQFRLMIGNAAKDNFTNILVEKNSSLLDHFIENSKTKTLNTIDSTIFNIISQIKAFAELEGHSNSLDFIIIKNIKSSGISEIIGTSGKYNNLKKKKRVKLPKDILEITTKTLHNESAMVTDNLETMYFFDNIDFETIFIFKNLSTFKYGARRIFNFAMHNSFLILSKIYEIKKREEESLQNIITINELLKGQSIKEYQDILKNLSNICNLNDFEKEQLWNVFHIYDLEKTLDLFKRDKKSVLSFQNKSFINLVSDISDQMENYQPKEHSTESPTLYTDIIRLVYIIKENGMKKTMKNKELYKIPNYIHEKLKKNIMH